MSAKSLRSLFLDCLFVDQIERTVDALFCALRERLRPSCRAVVARAFVVDRFVRDICSDPSDFDCAMGLCPAHCRAVCGCLPGGPDGDEEESEPPAVYFDGVKKAEKPRPGRVWS